MLVPAIVLIYRIVLYYNPYITCNFGNFLRIEPRNWIFLTKTKEKVVKRYVSFPGKGTLSVAANGATDVSVLCK